MTSTSRGRSIAWYHTRDRVGPEASGRDLQEGNMSEPVSWHRLFGLSLIDFFRGTPVEVKLEEDLSLKQQRLDVVILRKVAVPLTLRLPDGFEELAAHNLITFKSYQEALDGWALNELVGHYVNYR